MRVFASIVFFVLAFSLITEGVTNPANPEEERDPYHVRDAAQKTEKAVAEIRRPRATPPQRATELLPPPVLSADAYSGSFEGYAASVFYLKRNEGTFIRIKEGKEEYENNEITEHLSKVRGRFPYLRAYVDSTRPDAYRYDVLGLPSDLSDKPVTLLESRPVFVSNRIALDILQPALIEVDVGSLFAATGKRVEAKQALPLPDFHNQAPFLTRKLEKFNYGFWVSNPRILIQGLELEPLKRKLIQAGRAVFAARILDVSDPNDPRPICHVLFSKRIVGKKTFTNWGTPADEARYAKAGTDPACPVRELKKPQVELFEKASLKMRTGLKVAFVPKACPQAGTPRCEQRVFSYEVRTRNGQTSVLAQDLETGRTQLFADADPNHPESAIR